MCIACPNLPQGVLQVASFEGLECCLEGCIVLLCAAAHKLLVVRVVVVLCNTSNELGRQTRYRLLSVKQAGCLPLDTTIDSAQTDCAHFPQHCSTQFSKGVFAPLHRDRGARLACTVHTTSSHTTWEPSSTPTQLGIVRDAWIHSRQSMSGVRITLRLCMLVPTTLHVQCDTNLSRDLFPIDMLMVRTVNLGSVPNAVSTANMPFNLLLPPSTPPAHAMFTSD